MGGTGGALAMRCAGTWEEAKRSFEVWVRVSGGKSSATTGGVRNPEQALRWRQAGG